MRESPKSNGVSGDERQRRGYRLHRSMIAGLYVCSLLSVLVIADRGRDYYTLPLVERPRSELHMSWKPGGVVSHGLGVAGGLFMILLLYYVARKHVGLMRNCGNIRYALDYHIWLGVTAVFWITFHTTFKTGGIVGIAYWSVVIVALSGFLGRYVYLQIPRSLSGEELSRATLEAMRDELIETMEQLEGIEGEVMELIVEAEAEASMERGDSAKDLLRMLIHDLTFPAALWRIWRKLRANGLVTPKDAKQIVLLTRRRILLSRRMSILRTTHRILHYWHVVHRPVAVVVFIIMGVHVAVSIIFGYRWIW